MIEKKVVWSELDWDVSRDKINKTLERGQGAFAWELTMVSVYQRCFAEGWSGVELMQFLSRANKKISREFHIPEAVITATDEELEGYLAGLNGQIIYSGIRPSPELRRRLILADKLVFSTSIALATLGVSGLDSLAKPTWVNLDYRTGDGFGRVKIYRPDGIWIGQSDDLVKVGMVGKVKILVGKENAHLLDDGGIQKVAKILQRSAARVDYVIVTDTHFCGAIPPEFSTDEGGVYLGLAEGFLPDLPALMAHEAEHLAVWRKFGLGASEVLSEIAAEKARLACIYDLKIPETGGEETMQKIERYLSYLTGEANFMFMPLMIYIREMTDMVSEVEFWQRVVTCWLDL